MATYEVKCDICGIQFVSNHPRTATCASQECRREKKRMAVIKHRLSPNFAEKNREYMRNHMRKVRERDTLEFIKKDRTVITRCREILFGMTPEDIRDAYKKITGNK